MNYYYILKETENGPKWVLTSKKEDKITEEVMNASITLDPQNFHIGDLVEITSNPPPNPIIDKRPLEELLKELEKLPVPDWVPTILYNSYWPGGMLELCWKNEAYYVDRSNPYRNFSYCRSFETEEIVGIKIENLAKVKLHD